jgi:hypothetical protein
MKKFIGWFGLTIFFQPAWLMAADPLEEVTGTEEWDQVVPAAAQQAQEKLNLQEFRRQVDEWNSMRVRWQQEREDYFQEKAAWGSIARPSGRSSLPSRPTAPAPAPAAASEDWGDQPQGPSFSSTIDRVIDDEMGANRAPQPAAPPAARPQALAPPEIKENQVDQFSSFRGSQTGVPKDSGQLAPPGSGPARPAEPVRPAEPAQPPTPPKKTVSDDEAAGAAAAAELLRRFEEEKRREQEALMKKAQLQEDEEGQVVDPEIKKEMEKD